MVSKDTCRGLMKVGFFVAFILIAFCDSMIQIDSFLGLDSANISKFHIFYASCLCGIRQMFMAIYLNGGCKTFIGNGDFIIQVLILTITILMSCLISATTRLVLLQLACGFSMVVISYVMMEFSKYINLTQVLSLVNIYLIILSLQT